MNAGANKVGNGKFLNEFAKSRCSLRREVELDNFTAVCAEPRLSSVIMSHNSEVGTQSKSAIS